MSEQNAPLLGIKRQRSTDPSEKSYFCCCSSRGGPAPRLSWKDMDLTLNQTTLLNDLKTSLQEEIYDKNNTEHTELWLELWKGLNNDNTATSYPGDIGKHWVEMGFQQKDPSSDLRGAGVSGLRHLVHFVESDMEFCRSVLEEYKSFPFCVAGLNVSHCLFYHLQLYDRKSVPPYGSLQASSNTFRIKEGEDRIDLVYFIEMIEKQGIDKTLSRLYSVAFRAVIENWYEMRANSQNSSELDVSMFNGKVLPNGWKATELLLLEENVFI